MIETYLNVDNLEIISNIFGSMNTNIKQLEKQLNVNVELKSHGLSIQGKEESEVNKAKLVLQKLMELNSNGTDVTKQTISYLSSEVKTGDVHTVTGYKPDTVCITAKGRPICCKTDGQNKYVKAISKNDLTFALGPAGTGKTYLAVAMAVTAFRKEEVSRIILTRPAVEAGEKLGFLPGDLQMKVDPYMRPLYDALHELMGTDTYLKNMEKGLIEVSPLAYMRGRTLDDAFIILDEAQNTTPEQMKMFLTRMGFRSKIVVTGDPSQVDLQRNQPSGLSQVQHVLKHVPSVAFIELKAKDVVRNSLVQEIICAYDQYDKKQEKRRKQMNNERGNVW